MRSFVWLVQANAKRHLRRLLNVRTFPYRFRERSILSKVSSGGIAFDGYRGILAAHNLTFPASKDH